MSYGLRLWDASGKLKLSISDRLLRVIGTVSGTISQGQTVTIPIPANENPVYVQLIAAATTTPNSYGDWNYRVQRSSNSFQIKVASTDTYAYNYIANFYIL